MPIYEHHCLRCGLTFETLAPMRDALRKQQCPSCGRASARVVTIMEKRGVARDRAVEF